MALAWKLPPMTDPLGRHWHQPRNLRDVVKLHDTHAVVPEGVFLSLSRYDSSLPTGVYPGKCWRMGQKFLCWYGPERAGRCRIARLRVLTT